MSDLLGRLVFIGAITEIHRYIYQTELHRQKEPQFYAKAETLARGFSGKHLLLTTEEDD